MPTSTRQRINSFKTAIFASALSAGLILLILLVRDITAFTLTRAFEAALGLFVLGAIGADVYIWLADQWSILGRVVRTNLTATLKALLIVVPLATILSLVGIELPALHDSLMWIYSVILMSCIFSDAAYAGVLRGG